VIVTGADNALESRVLALVDAFGRPLALAAGLGEGEIAEFVEQDNVEARQIIGDPPLLALRPSRKPSWIILSAGSRLDADHPEDGVHIPRQNNDRTSRPAIQGADEFAGREQSDALAMLSDGYRISYGSFGGYFN
jgi:hypothetical protein